MSDRHSNRVNSTPANGLVAGFFYEVQPVPHGSLPARQRDTDVRVIAEVMTPMILAAMAEIQSATKAFYRPDAGTVMLVRGPRPGAFLHVDGLIVEIGVGVVVPSPVEPAIMYSQLFLIYPNIPQWES